MNVETISPIPPGEMGGPAESLDIEELAEQFPSLRFEFDDNDQITGACADLNVGPNERWTNVEKCNVPVMRLQFNTENGSFSPRFSVENGEHFIDGEFNKTLNKDELLLAMELLKDCQAEKRDPSSERVLEDALSDFTGVAKEKMDIELSAAAKVERKEYLPYDENVEINEDNLKSLEWLREQFRELADKPVDQGSESLHRIEVNGKIFEVLKSGDMHFLLNNKPTIELLDAAVAVGYITKEERSTYLIDMQEEAETLKDTSQKFTEEGEIKGEDKDYRKGNFWKTADANYRFDAFRQLNYLDICGEPVMDEFEKEYIQLLGANIARYDSAVLEVGFGMGISANAIQEKMLQVAADKERKGIKGEPSVHIIIELNHQVAEKAREWAKRQKIPVVVLEGDSRERIKDIPDGILTAVLADTYPLNAEEKHGNDVGLLGWFHQKSRPGAAVSYYPDSQYCLTEEHAEKAKKAGFKWIGSLTSRFAKEGKNTGEYFGKHLKMAIAVLFKDGGTGDAKYKPMSEEEKRKAVRSIFVGDPEKKRREDTTPIFSPAGTELKSVFREEEE